MPDHLPENLMSIGALARAGGLPVTTLRFYDAAGVLRPAHVDPASGYRWYAPRQVHTARLIASLRQAGLPVAELVTVLSGVEDAPAVLARHRRRLEEDLEAARRHLDTASGLLAEPARGTVRTADLVAGIGAVRHAVGRPDPEWPALAGVLLHLDGSTLRLVACDRFRIAVATVRVQDASGPAVRMVAPVAVLDELASATLPDDGPVALGPRGLDLLGIHGEPIPAQYPDYERLLRTHSLRGVTVAARELAEQAEGAGDVVVVRMTGDQVELGPPGARDELGWSRTFLLDAVRAARTEHVDLALVDDRSALSVTPAGRPHDVGMVMPIRLHRRADRRETPA